MHCPPRPCLCLPGVAWRQQLGWYYRPCLLLCLLLSCLWSWTEPVQGSHGSVPHARSEADSAKSVDYRHKQHDRFRPRLCSKQKTCA